MSQTLIVDDGWAWEHSRSTIMLLSVGVEKEGVHAWYIYPGNSKCLTVTVKLCQPMVALIFKK